MMILKTEKREFFKCKLLISFESFSITMNGLFENVTKLNRGTTIQTEIDELIPGAIAGNAMDSDDSEDDSLLPKISR